MVRAISVLLAVVVLLGVGWYFGARPGALLKREREEERRIFADKALELETRTREAETRAQLWAARGELLAAALDVGDGNFGLAGDHAGRARDQITVAAAAPGSVLELGPVRDMAEGALARVRALDPGAAGALRHVAEELTRLLERRGSA